MQAYVRELITRFAEELMFARPGKRRLAQMYFM